MADNKVVEVSFVFRGSNASGNAEAFLQYLDTGDGIAKLMEGIRHFGGFITDVDEDTEQKMIIMDGESPSDHSDYGDCNGDCDEDYCP